MRSGNSFDRCETTFWFKYLSSRLITWSLAPLILIWPVWGLYCAIPRRMCQSLCPIRCGGLRSSGIKMCVYLKTTKEFLNTNTFLEGLVKYSINVMLMLPRTAGPTRTPDTDIDSLASLVLALDTENWATGMRCGSAFIPCAIHRRTAPLRCRSLSEYVASDHSPLLDQKRPLMKVQRWALLCRSTPMITSLWWLKQRSGRHWRGNLFGL